MKSIAGYYSRLLHFTWSNQENAVHKKGKHKRRPTYEYRVTPSARSSPMIFFVFSKLLILDLLAYCFREIRSLLRYIGFLRGLNP